jgi:hypothetical protein
VWSVSPKSSTSPFAPALLAARESPGGDRSDRPLQETANTSHSTTPVAHAAR